MKEKIYCKNCKHKRSYFINQGLSKEDMCGRDRPKEVYNKYNGDYIDYDTWSFDANKNGDCKFYAKKESILSKKKWWKFWV